MSFLMRVSGFFLIFLVLELIEAKNYKNLTYKNLYDLIHVIQQYQIDYFNNPIFNKHNVDMDINKEKLKNDEVTQLNSTNTTNTNSSNTSIKSKDLNNYKLNSEKEYYFIYFHDIFPKKYEDNILSLIQTLDSKNISSTFYKCDFLKQKEVVSFFEIKNPNTLIIFNKFQIEKYLIDEVHLKSIDFIKNLKNNFSLEISSIMRIKDLKNIDKNSILLCIKDINNLYTSTLANILLNLKKNNNIDFYYISSLDELYSRMDCDENDVFLYNTYLKTPILFNHKNNFLTNNDIEIVLKEKFDKIMLKYNHIYVNSTFLEKIISAHINYETTNSLKDLTSEVLNEKKLKDSLLINCEENELSVLEECENYRKSKQIINDHRNEYLHNHEIRFNIEKFKYFLDNYSSGLFKILNMNEILQNDMNTNSINLVYFTRSNDDINSYETYNKYHIEAKENFMKSLFDFNLIHSHSHLNSINKNEKYKYNRNVSMTINIEDIKYNNIEYIVTPKINFFLSHYNSKEYEFLVSKLKENYLYEHQIKKIEKENSKLKYGQKAKELILGFRFVNNKLQTYIYNENNVISYKNLNNFKDFVRSIIGKEGKIISSNKYQIIRMKPTSYIQDSSYKINAFDLDKLLKNLKEESYLIIYIYRTNINKYIHNYLSNTIIEFNEKSKNKLNRNLNSNSTKIENGLLNTHSNIHSEENDHKYNDNDKKNNDDQNTQKNYEENVAGIIKEKLSLNLNINYVVACLRQQDFDGFSFRDLFTNVNDHRLVLVYNSKKSVVVTKEFDVNNKNETNSDNHNFDNNAKKINEINSFYYNGDDFHYSVFNELENYNFSFENFIKWINYNSDNLAFIFENNEQMKSMIYNETHNKTNDDNKYESINDNLKTSIFNKINGKKPFYDSKEVITDS